MLIFAIFMRYLIILLTKATKSYIIYAITDYLKGVAHLVKYEFGALCHDKKTNYIFQFVKGRKLTSVYHSHDFYELTCFLRGSATQNTNGKEVYCKENTVMLLRPEDSHCFVSQSDDIEIVSLSVKREEFELFERVYEIPKSELCARQPECIFLENVNTSGIYDACAGASTICECDCKLILSMFFCLYLRAISAHTERKEIPEALSYAMEQMKQTEHLKAGIVAFVSLSNYSHSHLSRLMKAHFGIGLKQYVNEQRLLRAYNEIVWTNEPFEVISEQLGFASYSHFQKIFKRKFSLTPSALRRGQKSKNPSEWSDG